MHEQDIEFVSDGFRLTGTLGLPEGDGPFPGGIFIAGSVEVDHNENHKKMRMNVLNELARNLADRGFASFRYDKRGVGASDGEFLRTGFYDNAAARHRLRNLPAQVPRRAPHRRRYRFGFRSMKLTTLLIEMPYREADRMSRQVASGSWCPAKRVSYLCR